MKYFVTGGSGRLGRPLIQELLKGGDEVVAHARSGASAATLRELGAQVVEGELAALGESELGGAEAVFHLAGGFRGPGRETPDVLNRQLTESFLERLPKGLPVILASSAAVYGDRSNLWVEEDFDPTPNTRYGASKVAAESLVLAHGGKIARIAAVYGPGFPFMMQERILQGNAWLPGEGRNHVPLVQVVDAVRALIAIAERGQLGEIYHVADRGQPTLGAFYESVHKHIGGEGVRFWSTYIPSYVQRWGAQQNERLQSRLGQRPRFTPDALKLWTGSVRLRTERLKDELSFSWRYADHEEGVPVSLGVLA